MTLNYDIDSIEIAASRVERKKTPVNTDPLNLDRDERTVVDAIMADISVRAVRSSFETYDQTRTFHSALLGMEAALASDWQGILAAAQTGLEIAFEVQGVSPYTVSRQDEAGRYHASEGRLKLKELALRLSHAAPAANDLDTDRAKCLRAMTCAAIAADRGLMHLVKENFGAVIVTIGSDNFGARRQITWTPALAALAQRYRNARVRMP